MVPKVMLTTANSRRLEKVYKTDRAILALGRILAIW